MIPTNMSDYTVLVNLNGALLRIAANGLLPDTENFAAAPARWIEQNIPDDFFTHELFDFHDMQRVGGGISHIRSELERKVCAVLTMHCGELHGRPHQPPSTSLCSARVAKSPRPGPSPP